MQPLDTRLAAYLVWGVGTLMVYGWVLRRRYQVFRVRPDRRSRRELAAAIALFLVSLAASLAVTFVLFGETGTGIRGLMSAIALGAFTGAGVVMAGEAPPDEVAEAGRE
jgi:hypothetical protein